MSIAIVGDSLAMICRGMMLMAFIFAVIEKDKNESRDWNIKAIAAATLSISFDLIAGKA